MEKYGLFRFAMVSDNGKPVVLAPEDELLKSETVGVVEKVEKSVPISVVEREDYIFTSQPNSFATFTVVTDKTVDADDCGDFLREMRKKWTSLFGRELPTDASFDSYVEFLRSTLDSYNENRIEKAEKEETNEENEVPEIILKEGIQEAKVTEIEDPVVTRETPLIAKEEPNDITLNTESNNLPTTFPQEHFDESLTSLRAKICWQRYKCLIIIIVLLALCLIIFFILCGGFKFKCLKRKNTKK